MRLIRYTYPTSCSLAPVLGGLAHSPWSGLETEIDRLFETALSDFNAASTAPSGSATMPPRDGESERQRQPGSTPPQHRSSETEHHGDDTDDEYPEDRQAFRPDEDDESDDPGEDSR